MHACPPSASLFASLQVLWSSESLSSYLMCIVEEPGGGAGGAVELGIVAVEPSAGIVLHSQFR